MWILVAVGSGNPDTQAGVLQAFMIMQALLCIAIGVTMMWLAQKLMKVVQLGETLTFDDIPATAPGGDVGVELQQQQPPLRHARRPSLPDVPPSYARRPSLPLPPSAMPITIVVPPSSAAPAGAAPAAANPATPIGGGAIPGVVNNNNSSNNSISAPPTPSADPKPGLLRGPSHGLMNVNNSGPSGPTGLPNATSSNGGNGAAALTPRSENNNMALSAPGTPSRPPQYQQLRVITHSLPPSPRIEPPAGDSPGSRVPPALDNGTNNANVNNAAAAAPGNGAEAPYLRVVRTNSTITRANI